MSEPYNILFLCTGNSARSIMAEALMLHWGRARFVGFSAGSHPKGQVHPLALDTLTQFCLPTQRLRSKSWSEFAAPGAPEMHFVFTVCDDAAAEVCPVWPGHPITAHWGIPDPAAVVGSDEEQRRAFRKAFLELETRIKTFISLPIERLDRMALQKELETIGQSNASRPNTETLQS